MDAAGLNGTGGVTISLQLERKITQKAAHQESSPFLCNRSIIKFTLVKVNFPNNEFTGVE